MVRYIDTPNTPNGIMAFEILFDFDAAVLNALDKAIESNSLYDGVTYLARASALYNCHSYAWYS